MFLLGLILLLLALLVVSSKILLIIGIVLIVLGLFGNGYAFSRPGRRRYWW